MSQNVFYYLNHIPLIMTWAYFYNAMLPVRKSYNRDFWELYLCLIMVIGGLLFIFEIPGSQQDNSFFRMAFSLVALLLISYAVKRGSWKRVLFVVILQQLLSISVEIIAMLGSLLFSMLNDVAFGAAIYQGFIVLILLDIFSLAVFRMVVGLFHRNEVHQGVNLVSVSILVGCQFLWVYLLSYKLILVKEVGAFGMAQSYLILLLTYLIIAVFVFNVFRQRKKGLQLRHEKQMNEEVSVQLNQLTQKEAVLQELFMEIHHSSDNPDFSRIRSQLREARNDLICEDPYINACLNYFRQIGQSRNIRMDFAVKGAWRNVSITPYDLNIILANLLKNAVSAAENASDPFVSLSMEVQRGLMNICVRNNGEARQSQNKKISGQGLLIVRDVVHRYQGQMETQFTPESSRVEVLLMV